MTQPLTPQQKVTNIQRRIDRIKSERGVITNIQIDYRPEFKLITLINDGFLTLKAVVSEDGKTIQVVKCPGWQRYMERKCELKEHRQIVICDSAWGPSLLSWQKLTGLCVRYTHDWIPQMYR